VTEPPKQPSPQKPAQEEAKKSSRKKKKSGGQNKDQSQMQFGDDGQLDIFAQLL